MDFSEFLARSASATFPHFSFQGHPDVLFSQCPNSLPPILTWERGARRTSHFITSS